MYYRYFNVYDNASDYNNANHGRTPNVSLVKNGADVHYQEIQFRTIVANNDSWTYQKEYENIYLYRDVSKAINKYCCLMLPFDYVLTERDCSEYTIAAIESMNDSGSGQLMTATLTPGQILTHNTPYLFKSPTASFALYGHRNKCYNLTNSTEPVAVYESTNGNGTLFNFYSDYTGFTCPAANTYYTMMTNGAFNWMSAGSSLSPYRWYFVKTKATTLQSVSNSSNGLLMGGISNPNNTIYGDETETSET